MEGWNMTIIQNLKVRVPSVDIQLRYRRIAEKIEEKQIKNKRFLETAEILFHSLNNLAFRGELTSNAADDLLNKAAAG